MLMVERAMHFYQPLYFLRSSIKQVLVSTLASHDFCLTQIARLSFQLHATPHYTRDNITTL